MWYVYNFRLNIIKELQKIGYSIVAIAPFDTYESKLEECDVECIDFPFKSNATNPISNLWIIINYIINFRKLNPDCIISFTVKPNIYGSIAARFCGIPIINNITGLGSMFISRSIVTSIIIFLYRAALRHSEKIFFQNNDDMKQFIDYSIATKSQSKRIPGSGVDIIKYSPENTRQSKFFTFLLIGRLLKDKGVYEYVEAAKIIIKKIPGILFHLLGEIEVDNPTTINRQEIHSWESTGYIRYLGVTDDVRPFIAESNCVVLPSYREGLSRTLLEAAAMGKPIITSDVPGCRDVVEDGNNGFLCKVKNATDLADKMERMIGLSSKERDEMGRNGRKKIEIEFNEKLVIKAYIDEINSIITKQAP